MTTTPVLLPLAEAAARLGISQPAVRRRLKAGKLMGERRLSTSGFQWWVAMPITADAAAGGTAPAAADGTADGTAAEEEAPGATTGARLASQRAADMAEYSHRLLAPYIAQITELSQRIGRLAAAEARVAELEAPAPETESAPSPGGEARRWWQRLL